MADSFILSNGGTQIDVASWVRQDPGVDFGAADLIKPAFTTNPYSEGVLAFEQTGPRRMVFPVLLSGSRSISNLGLFDQESLIRKMAQSGAVLDVKPDGATTAVRFDVLSGRYELDKYAVAENRSAIRQGKVILDTEPYGYWPTWIILASAASVGLPGVMTLSAPIGDAPALAELSIQPTTATNYPAGTWLPDFLAWSLGARASFVGLWPAASLASSMTATLAADAFAPASQSLIFYPSPTQGGWTTMALATIGQGIEPAYRGRFRAYAFAKLAPSQTPWYLSLDAADTPQAALASYNAIATLPAAVASGTPGAYAQASPAHTIVDLGEISLPPVASGAIQNYLLRLWGAAATSQAIASPQLAVGGLYLLPLDGPNGILPRGLAQPSIGQPTTNAPTVGRFVLDAFNRRAEIALAGNNLATQIPAADAFRYYRGGFPLLSPSTMQLDLLGGARKITPDPAANVSSYPQTVGSEGPFAYYRLEESTTPTLIDARGSWHGSYVQVPTLGQAGVAGSAPYFSTGSQYARVASLLEAVVTSFSVELWARRTAAGDIDSMISQGQFGATGKALELMFDASNKINWSFYADALITSDTFANEASYHHLVFTYNYTTRGRAIWRDATLIASGIAQSTYQASGPIDIGRRTNNTQYYDGFMDEIAFYRGTVLGTDIIREHYNLIASPPMGGAAGGVATAHVNRTAQHFASVSVRYRPRFQFIKGL